MYLYNHMKRISNNFSDVHDFFLFNLSFTEKHVFHMFISAFILQQYAYVYVNLFTHTRNSVLETGLLL